VILIPACNPTTTSVNLDPPSAEGAVLGRLGDQRGQESKSRHKPTSVFHRRSIF